MIVIQKSVFCNICNVSLGHDGGATNAHKKGKKHREKLLTNENLRKVIIHSSYDTPLQQEFIEFINTNIGAIDSYNFEDTRTIVVFKNVKSVNYIYSKKLLFNNKLLTLSKRNFTIFRNKSVKIKMEAPTRQLYGDFDQQLQTFVNRIQKSPHEINTVYLNLYKDLQNILNPEMPGCEVVPFGSTVTGLSFIDSDVDCFVHLTREYMEQLSLTHTDENKLHERLVNVAKKCLNKNRHIFTNIICVPKASIPIVKFTHISTGLQCDVSFKGGFGIHNSRLINVLLDTDCRLRLLFMYIKYWAKSHNLLGLGRFSSHALSMLIVYYLQQILPPILPSIKCLQEDCDNVYIDNWNCGFKYSVPNFRPHLNKLPVIMLLRGFFKFCSTFNFKENTICVFTASVYKLQMFDKAETFPPEFQHYNQSVKNDIIKSIGARSHHICIQDPFLHSRNVAVSVSKTNLHHFQQHSKMSCSIIDTTNNHQGIIDALLTQQIVGEVKLSSFKVRISNQTLLRKSIDFEYANLFITNVSKYVENIIRDVLKSTFHIQEKKALKKTNVASVSYICQLFYDLWSGRTKADNPNSTNRLEEEIQISHNMWLDKYKTKPEKHMFSVNLKILFENENISVTVILLKKKCVIDFNLFVDFFKTNIKDMITLYLGNCD